MTETELAKQQELNKKLSLILEADFGLLLRLQEFSGQLFIHSMTISSVSAQAARHMGGNVLLAQAGGLYHEIGRIMGVSNYIDAGVKLAEEYDFPKELTDIIRQHSMRHEKQSLWKRLLYCLQTVLCQRMIIWKKAVRRKVFLHRSW